MNYAQALAKLASIGQVHLLKYWDRLDANEREKLLQQISELDISLLLQQKSLLEHQTAKEKFQPFHDVEEIGNRKNYEVGKRLIEEGKAGCLLIAGGQGTRLRSDLPKGMFPVTPIHNKTLFQIFAEKTAAASRWAKLPLQLAIMTSPLNHEITVDYFKKNHFFGLEESQISFFSQEMLALMDLEGNLFLEELWKIAKGPDGNGKSLQSFFSKGIWHKWFDLGIHYLNYVLIDNPLADPFDAELIGFHANHDLQIAVKCTKRRDENERVGLLVKKNDKVEVLEYSEFPESEKRAIDHEGNLKHRCANISLFCFNMDFILETKDLKLPLHKALKAVRYVDDDGKIETPEKPQMWKFETFIFDLLPYANKVKALLYPRERCFAPLKNLNGDDSIMQVQQALLREYREILETITGKPQSGNFEPTADFYYPTPEILEKYKGKEIN